MAKFYCEYCGDEQSSISWLVANRCHHHPNGALKGNHKLYEGGEKSQYTCKYCGTSYSSIRYLVANSCHRHPDGALKGKHAPSLL
jgi:transcription elongation factor Elf1